MPRCVKTQDSPDMSDSVDAVQEHGSRVLRASTVAKSMRHEVSHGADSLESALRNCLLTHSAFS